MTIPMHLLGIVLVSLSRARESSAYAAREGVREFIVPAGGWAHRWFNRFGFIAITLSAGIILWRDEQIQSSARVYSHELAHVEQHRELGPFFLLAYGWASLVSFARGTGWYAGNALELEACAHEGPAGLRAPSA